jgi:bacterioferritin
MSAKTNPEYISLLNDAVSREIQVSLQYMLQHAKMEKLIRKIVPENILLDKTTYDAVGKFLREFAIAEMKHAASIMERIYYLGGSATTKSGKIKVGDTLSEFSKNGVKAEEDALILYRQIIAEAGKLGDWETREIFEKIYSDEEKHLFKFQEYANIKDEKDEPEEVAPSEWRKIFTKEYFDLLNKAVAAEIFTIIQYTNQHEKASLLALRVKTTALEVIQEKNKAQVVSDMLKPIFMVEMDHLEKLAERIYLLEGEVVFTPDPLPKVGDNADEFLKLDHEAENFTLVLYRKIIEEAMKRGDTKTRKVLEEIISQEEDHYWAFDDFVR